jgi:serine acetyltransferase
LRDETRLGGRQPAVRRTRRGANVNPDELRAFKRRLRRIWRAGALSPERLWLSSIRLRARGHWVAAFWLKQLNSLVYHNSLAPGATVAPDISLGHNSLGIVVSSEVEIGAGVHIWHNVTLTAGRPARSQAPAAAVNGNGPAEPRRSRIVICEQVRIGANAIVIAPRGETLTIGRGARVGAGTVVTQDVPPGGTIVGPPARLLDAERPVGDGVSGVERAG